MGGVLADRAGQYAWIEGGDGEDLARGYVAGRGVGAEDVGAAEGDWGGEGTEDDDSVAVEGEREGRGGGGFDCHEGEDFGGVETNDRVRPL